MSDIILIGCLLTHALMRVCPCLTVTFFRSKASFTKRSVSSRIACFDISRLFAYCTAINAIEHLHARRQSPSKIIHWARRQAVTSVACGMRATERWGP
jgi:hypothetical protein